MAKFQYSLSYVNKILHDSANLFTEKLITQKNYCFTFKKITLTPQLSGVNETF